MADLQRTKDEKENLQQMFTKTSQELTHQREEFQDKLAHMDVQVGGVAMGTKFVCGYYDCAYACTVVRFLIVNIY